MEVGDKFPDFVLSDENDEVFDSKNLEGIRYVILPSPVLDNLSPISSMSISLSLIKSLH